MPDEKPEVVRTAQANLRIGADELELLLYLRRARKLAGNTTLRVELEINVREIKPIHVMKLNPDPVLVLTQS